MSPSKPRPRLAQHKIRRKVGPESSPRSGVFGRDGPEAELLEAMHQARRHLRSWSAADAEDLLQDAMLLFIEKQAGVARRSWRAWISGTARNRQRELRRDRATWRRYEPLIGEHVRRATPAPVGPDAGVRQAEILAALDWLIEQVAPTRREVAERVLVDGETLESIAAATGRKLGTVASKWARAKREMREALLRERQSLDNTFFTVMLSILSAWCVWMAHCTRRAMAAFFAFTDRSSSDSRKNAAATLVRGRSLAVRMSALACAMLPLFLATHSAQSARPARSWPRGMASLAVASEHLREMSIHLNEQRDAAHLRFVPAQTTFAPSKLSPGLSRLPERASPAGARRSAGSAPLSPALRRMARGLLARAFDAMVMGDDATALDALRLYDQGIGSNPFPSERAGLQAQLRAMRAR